jgi:hypothetical protein
MNGKTGVVMGLVGVGVGTALMYWLDPANGRRRRDRARHATRRAIRKAQRIADTASRTIEKVSHMDLGDAAKMIAPLTAKALVWR